MWKGNIKANANFLGVCCMLLVALAYAQPPIVEKPIHFGYKKAERPRNIDVLILHSSFCPNSADTFSLDCVLKLYKQYDVGAHYIIDRMGTVYRLVADSNIAFHGGKGLLPDGDNRINSRSLGIEIINSFTTGPTHVQYASLRALIQYLQSRYTFTYILGHSDVAPGRKTDPWKFDWSQINDLLAK